MENDCYYALLAFDFQTMKALEIWKELSDKAESKYREDKANGKKPKSRGRSKEYEKFQKSEHYTHLFKHPYTKGIFKSKQDAVDVIEKYGYSIHEGNYYTHLLIERGYYGAEGIDLSDDAETWYIGESTGPEYEDYRYVETERPHVFQGTRCFL